MAELTKEQLIEEAKLKIAITKCHPHSGMARIEGELFKIALASLESEPVASCIIEDGGMCVDGFGEYVGHSLPDGSHDLYTAPPAPVVPNDWQLVPKKITLEMECALSKADSYEIGWLWALAAAPKYEVQNAKRVQNALNTCRAAMLQSQGEGNPHVTPARLPGGFTVEDAKELHENLVCSHISQALSGEKMKKKDRDADLRWIHGVIVQAAWFVKASLEQNALSGNYPVTPGGWISCSERMPDDGQYVIILCDGAFVLYAQYRDGEFFDVVRNGEEFFETQSRNVTDWMPLPEPPQEVNQ